ncbi:MAG: thiamine biosynthesis protein ApbE [Bacteroidetes bacterium GWF2_42_66]|nr:MAG: thiamine biosynthesis protein ApbE [Bacteroidetes bacterium GWA2_42_15]OFX97678.1 MAG: thiamine biosynthesis protein ApbE [Bacteroidetes bacterium GWE2_42_39]OFY46926.1 MAG: thiamine biosynthesis protein ApbE [Bacteroidetes bacterium GWF2_42_66]HBL75711.1 thiamine biosynthesis protein ApbE [Prolixibacteraceae bacterium]HCR91796.1 thiamine biosynthesis protein ApbE [Prolixibacteraceae bacterium]
MRIHLLIIAVFLVFACSCNQKKSSYITDQGFMYGTVYTVKYESPDGKDLQTEIETEMNRVNQSLSTFDSLSIISKVNRNQEVEPDDYFLTVFNKAMEVSEITGGAFDITVAPMVNVWGFGFKHKEQVTDELLDSLKVLVGYKKIRISGNRVIKDHPNTMLDCSAIAKGYGCDVVGNFLAAQGCKNYMVEIGGEVVAHGVNAKGNDWSIGVSKPVDDLSPVNQELKAIVSLKNKALATSGNYRNFYVEGGKKYAHTIDPKSGYPIQHSLLSSTVLADDCMTADAFATAFMVLGLDEAKRIAGQVKGLEVYFIYSGEDGEMKTWFSDGFREMLDKELD